MKRLLFFFSFLLVFSGVLPAQDDDARIPDYPSASKLYNNLSTQYPDFLTREQASEIERKLEAFNDSTSNEIFVVIADTLNGYEPWEYATKLGRKWKAGKADKNNGIVLLIKPTGGKGSRKTYIAVGKGLEGAIPETRSIHVNDDILTPKLASGDRYGAINDAVTVLMQMANGEYHEASSKTGWSGNLKYIIIAIILIVLFFFFSGGGGGYTMGGRGGYRRSGWGGSWGGGSWGGGSWGGGGGGSSWGGGGFSGGGGGSFGGGGSGGSW